MKCVEATATARTAGANAPPPYKLIGAHAPTPLRSALRRTARAHPLRPRVPRAPLAVLDEADSMTNDAQSALRRTMETYSKVTRFCIICNYISRLIPPIASRCAKFRFKPLPQEAMVERLQFICKEEGIHSPPAVLSELMARSEGDTRRYP